jgi:hypothetical protein
MENLYLVHPAILFFLEVMHCGGVKASGAFTKSKLRRTICAFRSANLFSCVSSVWIVAVDVNPRSGVWTFELA